MNRCCDCKNCSSMIIDTPYGLMSYIVCENAADIDIAEVDLTEFAIEHPSPCYGFEPIEKEEEKETKSQILV